MKLTRNGKQIGEVKLIDSGVPAVLPVVVFVITDETVRRAVFEQMKKGGDELALV